MDYNDNEFQSQNLQLAGEGNTKFPPVLRPYALPKFDFDDSLHGHLRFDSLVETEVFLGIESNEDNQWIEEYSRGGSGIEFRTSAAESCSISRHINVWSEATSSESVEMLLKSVGQEENIPGKTIMRESDACDELGCVVKQMELGPKHNDDNLSKGGDVVDIRPIVPPDGVGGGQPQADASFQKNKCESSVDGGLSDPVSDGISGKGDIVLSKESFTVDQRKVDTFIESLNNRTEEDSSASGMQYDSVVTSGSNVSLSGCQLNKQDAPPQKISISEDISGNVDVLQTGISGQQQECHFVQGAETNYQNLEGNIADNSIPNSQSPFCLASRMESLEEGNIIEAATGKGGESSNMLKEDTDLHRVEGCNENVRSVNQVSLQEFEVGDTSKVNIRETSPVALGCDNSSQRVEVDNAIDSNSSLLPPEDNKFSTSEAIKNSDSYGGGIFTTNMEDSTTQLPSEKPVNLTSKGVNDVSEVRVQDSKVNDSTFIVVESVEVHEGNAVSRQSDDSCIAVDKENTDLPSDHSNTYEVVVDGSKENEMTASKSHSDATASKEPGMYYELIQYVFLNIELARLLIVSLLCSSGRLYLGIPRHN